MTTALESQLYNCCPGGKAPDWSLFDNIEVNGVMDCATAEMRARGESDLCACDDEDAELWSVYGHLKTGGIECITDCETRADAEVIAALFLAHFVEAEGAA